MFVSPLFSLVFEIFFWFKELLMITKMVQGVLQIVLKKLKGCFKGDERGHLSNF